MATTNVSQDPGILERNLRALSAGSPELARRILAAGPRDDLSAVRCDDAAVGGSIRFNDSTLRLCSLRRPLEEASRLAGAFDPTGGAVAVVLGFGMGHHVRAVHQRLNGQGTVVVYEPDLALLRAVLSCADHSDWLGKPGLRFHVDGTDPASVSAVFEGLEGYVAAGLKIIEHPPSRTRLAASVGPFLSSLATAVSTIRTHVVTTLCQVGKTVGHFLNNACVYATSRGVEELRDAACGRAAVVVAAGPSFARNVELLSRPGVRDRVVIIAAQTVLKPLLARGIRPHFVTALDHAEISRRFFEGLTAQDVRGVTLVVEPKANPAIPAAFPGEIRCTREVILDEVLGPALARPMGALPSGATVAHLSYYLARHLGCDPVIMIGQDLGFTDGQYYAAGAAIHQVWSGELSEFNTLEMLEWQRIVRMSGILHKATDHLGRDVYTDEQMLAYRLQFERDFAEDRARGLRVIDATEGGVRKENTTIQTLAEALEAWAGPEVPAWDPAELSPPDPAEQKRRREAVLQRLRTLRTDAGTVRDLCLRTQKVLTEMAANVGNHGRVNPLIEKAQQLGQEAEKAGAAYRLIQHINQTGQLKRYRRDRLIALDQDAAPVDRQRRQIERDRENIQWLADAAEELGLMASRALDAARGARTTEDATDRLAQVTGTPGPKANARVGAVIPVHTTLGSLDAPRDLAQTVGGRNLLQWTVARLLRARSLDRVVLVTHEPARVRELLGTLAADPRVRIRETAADPLAARRRGVAAARRWTRACWRGGIGNVSVFDEAFAPRATFEAVTAEGLDAAVLVGPDWCLVEPGAVDALVARYRAAGGEMGTHQLMLIQAAPGLGACLLERGPIEEMATSGHAASQFASIGALMGYLPFAPQLDPIGKPATIAAPPAARDLGVRCIADSPAGVALLRGLLERPDALTLGFEAIAAHAEPWASRHAAPEILTLTLASGGRFMPTAEAERRIAEFGRTVHAPAITLAGPDDPLTHPNWTVLVRAAKAAGATVHVRTRLDAEADPADMLRETGVDVVSVDLLTTDPAAYEAFTGRTTFARAVDRTAALIERSTIGAEGLTDQWVVPRITRRDATYTHLEGFYRHWLTRAGACVIDPLPAAIEGERIAPLPVPASARRRREREEVVVGVDGAATTVSGAPVAGTGGVLELKLTQTTEAA